MYINDNALEQIFKSLPGLCAARCSIYIGEPMAYRQRLTLDHFASKGLGTQYSAIYRTPQEVEEMLEPLRNTGFSIKKQHFLPEQVGSGREETGSYLFILRR